MRYIVIIISFLLGAFGCSVFLIAGFEVLKHGPTSEYSLSDYAAIMGILGMLPFLIGIALSLFAVKKWGNTNKKYDIKSNSSPSAVATDDEKAIDLSNEGKVRRFQQSMKRSMIAVMATITLLWVLMSILMGFPWWPTLPMQLFVLLWGGLIARWVAKLLLENYVVKR